MAAARPEVKDLFQRLEEQQRAEALAGVREASNEPNKETEVIVVGAKGSGKTSLILGLINKDEVPKPTTALEYKFARRTSKEGDRTTIANIWELAGDTQLAQLLDVVLTTPKLANAQVVIVADLSKPSEVLNCVRYWLKAVRARVKVCAEELGRTEAGQTALRDLAARLPPASADVEPVGVPVVIVGAKYDAFAEASQASTNLLQVMARTLRFVAHTNGASVVYTSEQDKALLGAMKLLVYRHAFDNHKLPSEQTDYLKGIVVPAGRDSLQAVGATPVAESVGDRGARGGAERDGDEFGGRAPAPQLDREQQRRVEDARAKRLELFAYHFKEAFPSSEESLRPEAPDGGAKAKPHVVDLEAYSEEMIDKPRAQKLKELSQRAARLKAEAAAEAAAAAARAATRQR